MIRGRLPIKEGKEGFDCVVSMKNNTSTTTNDGEKKEERQASRGKTTKKTMCVDLEQKKFHEQRGLGGGFRGGGVSG